MPGSALVYHNMLGCFRSSSFLFAPGLVYYRQERYELAEYHFRRALAINHTSSILKCYIGMVLYANNHPQAYVHLLSSYLLIVAELKLH